MRRIIAIVTAAAGIVIGAWGVPAHAAAVSWKAQTCAAFTAYQAHPTSARLATLVTDSTHLGKSYLKADVGQLYADASSPSKKAAKYVAKDEQYLAEDCPAGAATMAADAAPAAAPRSLPRWAHWKTAPYGACSQAAGIIVWARHGDSVLICSDGNVEPS